MDDIDWFLGVKTDLKREGEEEEEDRKSCACGRHNHINIFFFFFFVKAVSITSFVYFKLLIFRFNKFKHGVKSYPLKFVTCLLSNLRIL